MAHLFSDQQQPKDFSYASPIPYPPLTALQSNLQYAHILMIDFASAKSELTTINQYNYQSWVTEAASAEISNVLHQTAMVEMRHLNILGRMITLLGGNPQYISLQNKRPYFWTGKMVAYDDTLNNLLKKNISDEQYAIDLYTYHITLIQDETIIAQLNHFILDEKCHLQNFTTLLQNLC